MTAGAKAELDQLSIDDVVVSDVLGAARAGMPVAFDTARICPSDVSLGGRQTDAWIESDFSSPAGVVGQPTVRVQLVSAISGDGQESRVFQCSGAVSQTGEIAGIRGEGEEVIQ